MLYGQTKTIPSGQYYTENDGMGFYLTIDNNKEFQIAIAKGYIEIDSTTNLVLSKQKTPTFGLKFIESNSSSDSLTVSFSKSLKNYQLGSIFIATSNKDKDYQNVDFKKASTLAGSNFYQNTDLKLTIAKATYLYLLEDKMSTTPNILYSYELPKNTSKVEVSYHSTPRRAIKLVADFDSKDNIVTVNEIGRNNPLIFYKDYSKYLSQFEVPASKETGINWQEELITENYSNSTNFNFELERFDNSYDLFKKAVENNKTIVALYLPDDNNKKKRFNALVKTYESKVSNLMYNTYLPKYDTFYLYHITETEKKLIDDYNLKDTQLLAIDTDGTVLYRNKGRISELEKVLTTDLITYSNNEINNRVLLKHLDDAIVETSFNQEETQNVFHNISKITSYDFFSGHESVTEKSYMEQRYEEQNIEFYRLKSNLDKVNSLFEKLVDAHQSDITIDFQYADILTKFLSVHYSNILYKIYDANINEADLKGVDYLIKFKDQLNNYQAKTDDDYNKGYNFSDISTTITSTLRRASNNASPTILQGIKNRFEKTVSERNEYLSFLKRYIPNDFIEEYKKFYSNSKFNSKTNTILTLNSLYTSENSNKVWSTYKNQIANQANDAAWAVVENTNEKKIIKEALKWSKTSLDIEENNPYYLDTYAQLLYKNGDKKTAIKFQTKAVKVISDEPNRYGMSLLKQTKEVLSKMKSGKY